MAIYFTKSTGGGNDFYFQQTTAIEIFIHTKMKKIRVWKRFFVYTSLPFLLFEIRPMHLKIFFKCKDK